MSSKNGSESARRNVPLQVVGGERIVQNYSQENMRFRQSATIEFVGIHAVSPEHARNLACSPALLDALLAGLEPGEALVAHLNLESPASAGLEITAVSGGSSRRAARARSKILGELLEAALVSGLPCVELRQTPDSARRKPLRHSQRLAPAGVVLPLSPAPVRGPKGKLACDTPRDWIANQKNAVVFSAQASGMHLAGLGNALAHIKTPLTIELRLTRRAFSDNLLQEIEGMRVRIRDRIAVDTNELRRDSRYSEADLRLENLVLAASGVELEVTVRSKRELAEVELSALSAAMFGTPHANEQPGHLASLRALYPREEAVQSFLGIVAAAAGPAIERRQVGQLDEMKGNVVGKLKSGHAVRMAVDEPRSHTYMIGRPGSGKSTLLLNLILQDIEAGHAVVVIDPHGDLWADIRARLPAHRLADVQLVHMADPEFRPQLNVLELGPGDPEEARARVIDTLCQLVRRLMFSGLTVDATGPMFNKYFRAALMLLMEGEGTAARIQDAERIFTDETYRRELLARPSITARTRDQWKQITRTGGDHDLDNVTPWITSKLTLITQSAILLPILSVATTSLDFERVLAEKKICLINLAIGQVGDEPAALLGGILTHRLERAALAQSKVELAKRHTAAVYFDEFHTFASELLRSLMSGSRKYGLRMMLANQTLSQMINNDIDGGVFKEVLGNCANTIAFAVDSSDAAYLTPRFGGRIDPNTVVAQPNYQAICVFQSPKGSLGPFVVKTLPAPPPNDTEPQPD